MQTNTLKYKIDDKVSISHGGKEIEGVIYDVFNDGRGRNIFDVKTKDGMFRRSDFQIKKLINQYKVGDYVRARPAYLTIDTFGEIVKDSGSVFIIQTENGRVYAYHNEILGFAQKPPVGKFKKGDRVTTELKFNCDSEFEVVGSSYDQKYNVLYYKLRGVTSGTEYEIDERDLRGAPKFKYKVGDFVNFDTVRPKFGTIIKMVEDGSRWLYRIKGVNSGSNYDICESQIIGLANTDNTPKRHALYSAEADKNFGHCIYLGVDGQEVKVTNVNEDLVKMVRGYLWNDAVYVGQVTKCLKVNKGGRFLGV